MLVGAAGRNANLLLNVGPMPNGEIQPENIDTLKAVGAWTSKYGSSIFGTRGKLIEPQDWGVLTGTDQEIFIHILQQPENDYIFLPGFTTKILHATNFDGTQKFNFRQVPEGTFVYPDYQAGSVDYVVRLALK